MPDDRPVKVFHAPIDTLTLEERTNLLELAMRLSRRYQGICKVKLVPLPAEDAR